MSLEEKFDKRIASIHQNSSKAEDFDIRHEEFQAMADAFLGEDFDQEALLAVENLQTSLESKQALLYASCQEKTITPEEYVDNFNHLVEITFIGCEHILGKENFIKLFGAPRTELAGFIDKDTFLQAP